MGCGPWRRRGDLGRGIAERGRTLFRRESIWEGGLDLELKMGAAMGCGRRRSNDGNLENEGNWGDVTLLSGPTSVSEVALLLIFVRNDGD